MASSYTTLFLLIAATAILCGHAAVQPGKHLRGPLKAGATTVSAYTTIQAETFSSYFGVVVVNSGGVTYVGSIDDGDYICYDSVDFQDGAVGVYIRMSSSYESGVTGNIDLTIGSPTNTPFQSVVVGSTHSDSTWFTINDFLVDGSPTGVWPLCLVFRDSHHASSFVNVDWFYFFQ